MGSGTCGIAALNLDRRFLGIEIDEKRFNVARGRLSKYQQQKALRESTEVLLNK